MTIKLRFGDIGIVSVPSLLPGETLGEMKPAFDPGDIVVVLPAAKRAKKYILNIPE